ncbi:MAG: peptidylprolyl isomerase [Bacteroidetes bacterium]|nr:peptidylprolyl isomerase [Bacteroidota bacterium]
MKNVIMFKYRVVFFELLLIFLPLHLLFAFSAEVNSHNSDEDTVIQISARSGYKFANEQGTFGGNNYIIGFREFEDRLNDLPLPNESGYPLDELKENMACTLIAETILANEAKKEKLDNLPQVKLMAEEYHKEALYEQWMNSEVTDKIKVSEKEIQKGYNRLKEIRYVDYWTSPSLKEASKIRNSILKGLKPGIKHILKKLEYGEALENVEDSVYSLKIGQTTLPIKVDSLYYVFKLIKTETDKRYAKEDIGFYKSTILDRLKSKEKLYLVSSILNVLMKDKGYNLETGPYKFLLQQLQPIIFNNQLPEENRAEIIQQELVTKKVNSNNMFKKPMIVFKDGKVWTVKDVWNKLAVCPYPLNYDTPEELESGLQRVIKEIVLLESIAKDAQNKELSDSFYVKYQSQMWTNNLLAQALLDKYRKSISMNNQNLLAFYDSTKNNYIEPERRKIIPLVVHDKKLADRLFEKIDKGADILSLAKKYSLNKVGLDKKEPGIYITPYTWGEAGKSVFKLKPGQITRPKKVDDSSYAIIKLIEVKSAAPYPFDQIRDQLYSTLQDQKLQKHVNKFLLKVIKNYRIMISWKELSKVQYFGGSMGVEKTHFPLRNAVPGFPLFNHNAKWFNEGVSKNKY